jgi:hypothetical protein
LVLNVPSDTYFLLIGFNQLKQKTPEDLANKFLFYACVNFIHYANYSINFLMYFVSGRKFRLAAKDTITCQWNRKQSTGQNGKSATTGRPAKLNNRTADTSTTTI